MIPQTKLSGRIKYIFQNLYLGTDSLNAIFFFETNSAKSKWTLLYRRVPQTRREYHISWSSWKIRTIVFFLSFFFPSFFHKVYKACKQKKEVFKTKSWYWSIIELLKENEEVKIVLFLNYILKRFSSFSLKYEYAIL